MGFSLFELMFQNLVVIAAVEDLVCFQKHLMSWSLGVESLALVCSKESEFPKPTLALVGTRQRKCDQIKGL